jgi:signal recognition particle subunit SRP54
MFDRITDGFNSLLRKVSGKDTISESNVREAMQDVRSALIDADVHHSVVDEFIEQVLNEALGKQVTKSLEPGQEMIGVVYHKLIEFLGGTPRTPQPAGSPPLPAPESGIYFASPGPTVIMMCGLQGSGKTTTSGKLAGYLKKRGKSVMLAAADLQRPAAVDQLETIAKQVEGTPGNARVLFYSEPQRVAEYGKAVGVAVDVCRHALDAARKAGVDVLILDTAGRLHINDELMQELGQVKFAVQPHQIFLVVDAMTGQDAVNSARNFHEKLAIDGVILTKFDSDTRGGAALSVKKVTGAPIKFIGVGEKLDAIEEFYPDRIASRMLGMGDVLSLVEKAQAESSEEEAIALNKKLESGEMSLDDFLKQLRTIRRMGPLKQLMGLLPGVGSMLKDVNLDEKHIDRVEAIIQSMTPAERKRPTLLDNSRRRRISKGSSTQPNDVGQLVKQFEMVNQMTKTMSGLNSADKMAAVQALQNNNPAALASIPGLSGKGSTYTPSIKQQFKKRRK